MRKWIKFILKYWVWLCLRNSAENKYYHRCCKFIVPTSEKETLLRTLDTVRMLNNAITMNLIIYDLVCKLFYLVYHLV